MCKTSDTIQLRLDLLKNVKKTTDKRIQEMPKGTVANAINVALGKRMYRQSFVKELKKETI